jgi:hypothetical protein
MHFLYILFIFILSWMILPATFSAESLAPISTYQSGVRASVDELDSVIQSIAKTIEQSPETVKKTLYPYLNSGEAVHNAFVRRFNLESPFYREFFRQAWHNNPQDAFKLLTEGYTSKHDLNNQGQLILNRLEMQKLPPKMLKEIAHGLDGKRVYGHAKIRYENVMLEWAWIPEYHFWCPIAISVLKQDRLIENDFLAQPVTILKTVLDANQMVVKVGRNLTRTSLRNLFKKIGGDYMVFSRIPSGGRVSLGRGPLSTDRFGMYYFDDRRDELFLTPLGRDSIVTEFRFFDIPKLVQLRLAVEKNASGEVIKLFESHRYFTDTAIAKLMRKSKLFWIQQIYVNAIQEGAKNIYSTGFRLGVSQIPGTDQIVGHPYNLPLRYAGQPAEALIAESGVPAYLFVLGKKKVPNIEYFLKRLEIRNKKNKLLYVISSHYINIAMDKILQALEAAARMQGQLVVSNLKVRHDKHYYSPETFSIGISVGNQYIQIPSQFIKNLPSSLSYAELVYDPSSIDIPIPIEIRLGKYTHNNPLQFATRRFVPHKTFLLKQTPGKNFFIALDPSATMQPLQDFTKLKQNPTVSSS